MNSFDRTSNHERGSSRDAPPLNGDRMPPPPPLPGRGQPPSLPPLGAGATEADDGDDSNESNGVYLYNVADGLEEDPEIIRSELLFFNTPRMQQYSDYVYYSLKNIEAECASDYEKLCDDTPDTLVFNLDFGSMLSQFLLPSMSLTGSTIAFPNVRKLSSMEIPKVSPAVQLVNNLRSLYYSSLPSLKRDYLSSMVLRPVSSGKRLEDTPIIPVHTWNPLPPKTEALTTQQVKSVSAGTEVNKEKSVKGGPVIPSHTWTPPKTAAAVVSSSRRRLQMAHSHDHGRDQKRPPGPDADSYSDSDSDSDSEDSPPKGKKPCPHHLPPDNMFAGAIGFGAEGDLCMYHNLDALSQPCQQAVADLYQLRQQFWIEDSSAQVPPPPHPHHPFLLLAPVLLLGAVLMFKRYKHQKRRKEVNQLLASLHSGDASLKKAVEQQAKMSIPVPLPVPPCSTGSFCCRLVKTLFLMIFVLVSSIVIAVSSLEITAAILNTMQPASSPVALLVLVSVCTVELALFFLLVKAGKTLFVKHCGADASPSAPFEQEEDEGNNHGGGGRFLVVRKKIQELRNFAFHSFRFPSSSSSSPSMGPQYYTPLLQQEETTATEMTTVSPAVVRWQSPAQDSQQQYAIVPVTANTFNNISMV